MPIFISNIPTITPDEDFVEVKECDYKGEHYSVRDNGAIMRHVREGKSVRKNDNVWTFGKQDGATGYMLFCGARVHIIVATAFHGVAPSSQHVVDHIDTNHCNNRPENLRWLTKLENAFNNPMTRKRIEYLCGGDIQKFIDNPSCLHDLTGTNADISWMRTVTSEEAKIAYKNVMSWAAKPSEETPSHGGKMGEWIYREHTMPEDIQDTYFDRGMLYDLWGKQIGPKPTRKDKKDLKENNVVGYFETSNKLAQQIGWQPHTKPEFPCCPIEVGSNPLQDYSAQLEEGKVFVSATYGASIVYKHIIQENWLLVITKILGGAKNFGLTRIIWNGKVFVHESMGTFIEENGALAAFTRAQGLEWNGPKSIDDYC